MIDKLNKSYEPNTILTIVFDDSILYPEDWPKLQPWFRELVLRTKAFSTFFDVYILGVSGKMLWEFGNSAATK